MCQRACRRSDCDSCRSGVDATRVDASETGRVAALYRLPERYLLFVGTVEPRKNLRGLATAVSLLDDPLPLIVAGAEGWGDVAIPSGGDIRFIGFVPPGDLGGLYAGAEVFCYPSEREGYGLPVLEAMVQGTPVVTSRGTATEEAADGAAVLVDPYDPADIARGIAEAGGAARDVVGRWDGPRRPGNMADDGAIDRRCLPGVVLMVDPAVAVNLLWCVPGDVGGSEEYLVRQLLGLADATPRVRPTLYVVDGFVDAHRSLSELYPTVVAPFDGRSRVRRILGEASWFRRRTSSADLRHHAGGTAPPGAAQPYVLTIHDLQYRTFPEYFSRTKRAYLAAMIGRSVRRALVVTVPSEYVRGSVIEAFGADPSTVRVVPHGFEPDHLRGITDEAELRRRFSLGSGPVIVYPAVTHRHKNHRFLIDLLASKWRDPELRLVLIGGSGTADREVRAAADPRIRRLGRVPAADRNGLLSMAEAMVFPSEYEGFGAPLIEAMALGCPVIASDSTCIPAVVDSAGLVLPLVIDAWSGALDRVRRDRETMIAAGLRRAELFTARASGAALAGAYADALERS